MPMSSDFIRIGVVHLRFQIDFENEVAGRPLCNVAFCQIPLNYYGISDHAKVSPKRTATMPSESLLGIAGDISASTGTELY